MSLPAADTSDDRMTGLRGKVVLVTFSFLGYRRSMPDDADTPTPADPRDLADAIAFALRYRGGKRVRTLTRLWPRSPLGASSTIYEGLVTA